MKRANYEVLYKEGRNDDVNSGGGSGDDGGDGWWEILLPLRDESEALTHSLRYGSIWNDWLPFKIIHSRICTDCP